jgi:hypothetical protein
MTTTWLGNDIIENIFKQSFFRFDLEFSKLYETQARTQEERLTGYFIEKIVNACKYAQANIQSLSNSLEEPFPPSIAIHHPNTVRFICLLEKSRQTTFKSCENIIRINSNHIYSDSESKLTE